MGVAQACVHTSQACAQFACDTEHISDPINKIRTQACQSKLILINASREGRVIFFAYVCIIHMHIVFNIYILPAMLSVPARYRLEDR